MFEWVFSIRSAKGAARATDRSQEQIAPRSVLRVFLKRLLSPGEKMSKNTISKCLVIAILSATGLVETGFAQGGRGVKYDQAVVARGRDGYRLNCATCHGIDARGTDLAPDLARSLLILSDENGKELGDFLKQGRTNKGMPAFTALTQPEISDLATFLHERVQVSLDRTIQSSLNILVGNAKAGEAYFNGAGKCNTCHSPTGDLKGIGTKYDPIVLQDRFVNPRPGGGAYARDPVEGFTKPPTVKVTTPSGQVISGTLVLVTDFHVALIDSTGARRSFARENDVPKVEVAYPLQAHLDQMLKYTNKDMHDLTAYLVTLK